MRKLLAKIVIGWAAVGWISQQSTVQIPEEWVRHLWRFWAFVSPLQPAPDLVVAEMPPIQVGVVPVETKGTLSPNQRQPYRITCQAGDRLSAKVAPDNLWLILSTADEVIVQQGAIAPHQIDMSGIVQLDVRNPGRSNSSYVLTISVKR